MSVSNYPYYGQFDHRGCSEIDIYWTRKWYFHPCNKHGRKPEICKRVNSKMFFDETFQVLSKRAPWRRRICLSKLSFSFDLWWQCGHWNLGSFPHCSCLWRYRLFFQLKTFPQSQGKVPRRWSWPRGAASVPNPTASLGARNTVGLLKWFSIRLWTVGR